MPSTISSTDNESSFPAHSLLENILNDLQHEWLSECDDLKSILSNPHLKALLSVSDCVAQNVYNSDHLNHILQVLANESTLKDDHYDNEFDDTIRDKDQTKVGQQTPQRLVSLRRRKFVRHRMVNLIKSEESPLGVTVRLDRQTGDVYLARILVGSAAHRSGLVNVGDKLLSVNGINLRGCSHMELISILQRECRKTVISFQIVVRKQIQHDSLHATETETTRPIVVRTHFDYDPSQDGAIPCNQIGLSFTKGTILSILNRDDQNWWQASKEIEITTNKPRMEIFQVAGLVPSKSLQERRVVAIREMQKRLDRYRYITILAALIPVPFCKYNWPMRKVRKMMYDIGESFRFDREEIVTYEPVAKFIPEAHHFRPIILVGPIGMGISGLIKTFVNYKPHRYCEPILHTSRYQRFAETDGYEFWFVSEAWFEKEIKKENFVWHSKIRGNYYGLHKSSVRSIIDSSLVCIFKMDPSFLRHVHTAEFKPYVIFIRPPFDLNKLVEKTLKNAKNSRKSRTRIEYEMRLVIYEAHKMNFLYGHKFDTTVINENLNETFRIIYEILISVESEPKWVPSTWVVAK